MLDLIFYGFRTLRHTKELDEIEFYITLVLIFLVSFDLFEIWQLISFTVISDGQFDLYKKRAFNKVRPLNDDSVEITIKDKTDENIDFFNDTTQNKWTNKHF